MVTDTDIKNAIASIIRNELVSLYGSTEGNLLPVYSFWNFSYKLGDAINLMKIPSGSKMGEVHGWMIGTYGLDRKRPDLKEDLSEAASKGRLKILGANKREIITPYRIWCFMEYDPSGNETNTSNSENRLVAEITAIADKLDEHPMLGLTDSTFQGHTPLSFPKIDTFASIDHLVRIAQGEMSVVYNRNISGNDRTAV